MWSMLSFELLEKMMKIIFVRAVIALALNSLVPFSAIAGDLMEKVATDGSFKTLAAAIKAAGMTETLKRGGPYTIFAPTDEAFTRLPKGTWDSIVKDKARLTRVLSQHIVPGLLVVAEVKPGNIETMKGEPLLIKSDNGMITIGDASVTQSDLKADNGVIQGIDRVIMPK